MDTKEEQTHTNSDTSSEPPSAYSSENVNLEETIDNKDSNVIDGKKIIKGGVSDDEEEGGYGDSDDEEGGFVSGKEEFEPALEKENTVLSGSGERYVEEVTGKGHSDGTFLDASEISAEKATNLPDSGVLVSGDDAEEGLKDAVGDKVGSDKDYEANSAELKGVLDSEGVKVMSHLEKAKQGLDKGGTENSFKNEDSSKKDVVTLPEAQDVTDTSPEESKVNFYMGEAENGSKVQGGDAGKEVVQKVETYKVESEEKGKVEDLETKDVAGASHDELNTAGGGGGGGEKLTPEGDSVVDDIQVDVESPGVVIVGEKEEQGGEKPQETLPVELVGGTNECRDVKFTPEGDSVVDTIQIDVSSPGVAIVGEKDEHGREKTEVTLPVAVVGGSNECGGDEERAFGTREVSAEHLSTETSNENTDDTSKEKKDAPHVAATDCDGLQSGITTTDSVDRDKAPDVEKNVKKQEEGFQPTAVSETAKIGITPKVKTYRDVVLINEIVGSVKDAIQPHNARTETVLTNGELCGESKSEHELQEITELEDDEENLAEETEPTDFLSEGDADGMIFGSSEAARKFIEELEQGSGSGSHAGADSSFEQSQRIDGQFVSDSEEEADSDDEGDGKGIFDSTALAALLKAATGVNSDSGVTITSQDGSRLFSVERPAGLGSSLRSLRPAPATRSTQPNLFGPSTLSGNGESEENLNEEEKKKLENFQKIRVKFLRLVHRLGVSSEESVAAQVLYRLALLGRQGTQTYSLDAAKRMALQLEENERDDLDFSINILLIGKSGLGKSATINSIFGEDKSVIDAFETGTASVKLISGSVDGVKVRVVDTPGLKSSALEQGFNRNVLLSVKNFTKKCPPDVVLYVDRLDAQTRDLNDLPLLRTITTALGPSIWRSAIVTLTHAASAPPDGPSGTPLSYEVFVTQRSHVVQQSIGHAVGDLRMMSPSLMNPVSLVENHPACRKNRDGQKILPNGQSWRPQLLLLCYSMKILSEASSLAKPLDQFDHRKIFGFRARAPPLPYMLSSMLQSRAHPKLPSDQGGDSIDSDIDLDDFSDSDREEEDEYDQLPPFKPLRKAQIAKLTNDQSKAYFEEYDYRVKLLQRKQWKEELRRMREMKKKGKDFGNENVFAEDDVDPGAAAPVAVPLPDMALPPSFDGNNPSHRYRFLEPTSQFLARPVLDTHGWDHDCGYDGVNLEHNLAIANRFPGVYTIQITKDKKDFSISLDSSIAAKHGDDMSTMVGFDIQSMGKQLAYIVRGETKVSKLKKNKAGGGISVTFLGHNVVPGVKVEDHITLGKQYVLVGGAGAVRSQQDTAYGANFELQRRELDYPIGQVQSTISMSVIKWKGDLALGFNTLAQFSVGRNSKVAVRAGINNKLSGQVTVRTSSSDHLSLALAAIIPTAISIYRKLWSGASEKYSIY